MMGTRSRKGCIDCKQAKVKCDEAHPSCGTCARRGRKCRGYYLSNINVKSPAHRRRESNTRCGDYMAAKRVFEPVKITGTAVTLRRQLEPSLDTLMPAKTTEIDSLKDMITEASANSRSLLREPNVFPANEILATDKTFVEIYFMRHPPELVMGNEFINEMNDAVISLVQESPKTVCETLSAIGETYMRDVTSDVALSVLSRKTRLLNRLRLLSEDGSSIELILGTLLGLCAIELIQHESDGRGIPLLKLVENLALILELHLIPDKELSRTAKYFARALARQDLLMSFSHMKRTKINPSIWLDEYSMTHADRLWGYTTTLAPLLTELCALAEDVQSVMGAFSCNVEMETCAESDGLVFQIASLAERETHIRDQLLAWRPTHDFSVSMQTARKVLLHAYAWRAAALLYLYRLFNRPGSSVQADQSALGMAYEVMLHISGPGESIKLSLWPLFLAACEMDRQEDREKAEELFEKILRARPTVTGRRTKWFCTTQVWPARDRGRDWDWMLLSQTELNAFIPI